MLTFTPAQSLQNTTEIITTNCTNHDFYANFSNDSTPMVTMVQFFRSSRIKYIHSAVLIAVNAISICSNLSVIYLYAMNKFLHTRPNIIVMSLTSSDLLYAVIMFSFGVTTNTVLTGTATFSCVLINFALRYICVTVSAWSLVALTVDRYLSIHMPFQSRRTIPKVNYIVTVAGIWCLGVATTGLMAVPWHRDNITNTVLCGGLVEYTTLTTCVTVLVQAILPIIVIAILYSRIAHTAEKHRRAINNLEMQVLTNHSPEVSARNRQQSWFTYTTKVAKGTKILLFASLSLIVTWTPIFIVLQLFVFCTDCHKQTLYFSFLFGSILFNTKGFIHPLAYTLRDKQFKKAAMKTMDSIRTTWKTRGLCSGN